VVPWNMSRSARAEYCDTEVKLKGRKKKKKKKQIGINHTREGIGRVHQPAGQVKGEK
jgi:hypothetical protein